MNDSDATGLWQLLEAAYGVAEPGIALIRNGSDGNRTFKITASGGPFIARIYGEHGRLHPEWARYELEMLTHLANNGISVAAPIAARDGAWMQFLPGEPPAPVALFAFADGRVEWPTSAPRAHLLGAAFAHLHLAADSFRTAADPRAFDLERLFDAPLRRIRPYLDDSDPDDREAWETWTRTAAQAAALIAAVPDADGAIGPIHGDLHQGNCHFTGADDSDGLTFFDFSNAGVGRRVYDLSGFLWPLRDDTIKDPAVRAACDAFLEGYRSVRLLRPEEERAIAASVKARDYWETGSWLEFDKNADPATVRDGLRSMAAQFRRFPLPA